MIQPMGGAGVARILRSDPNVTVGEVGALCVVVWHGAVTRESFQLESSGLTEVAHRHPGPIGFVCLVRTSAKPPDDEMRRASVKMVEGLATRIAAVAIVIEGEGFLAAINRGVVAGMLLLARNLPTPVSVFAAVADVPHWLRRHIAVPESHYFASAVAYVARRGGS
jgi:hypothetical protein